MIEMSVIYRRNIIQVLHSFEMISMWKFCSHEILIFFSLFFIEVLMIYRYFNIMSTLFLSCIELNSNVFVVRPRVNPSPILVGCVKAHFINYHRF